MLVVQADSSDRSRIQTVIVAVITSNMELAGAPGKVLLPARVTGLPRDSVVNVSQLLTLDRAFTKPYKKKNLPESKTCGNKTYRMVLVEED